MTTVDRMKPSEGSWTEHYPELGTGLVSYEDCTSPEFYELEREAVFKRVWLMVGRVEQLPRNGSYFTRELAVAKTSVVLVRGMDGGIRAFHNICRHRGNKLVWTDYPGEETAGNCRQFACKYHGWRYDLDGTCAFVQQEREFFGLDKAEYGLVPVHCDVWEGFIFIHLGEQPSEPLTEFLGSMLRSVEGYPFGLHTEHYGYQAKVGSNWKLFFDAFQEYYHAPVLHANQTPAVASVMREAGFSGAYYQLDGPHRLSATGGSAGRTRHLELLKPMERLTRSGLIGPWDGMDFSDTASGLNLGGFEEWTVSAFHIFPNTTILFRGAGWYLTYSYWPTSYNTHIFEGNLYFTPSRSARERVAHEMTRATHKEYGLQDCNTLEATQMMLESGVLSSFPLSDHEVLCRHLHKVVGEWVEDYKSQREKG
jgi:Rieske 2Fe-2S family protein